ncbi:MAG: TonB-dependent receptor [Gemmatimonadaceae bacterium]|nr:TonB-dependent receptor [Gemmatimonadaceae bacterium]
MRTLWLSIGSSSFLYLTSGVSAQTPAVPLAPVEVTVTRDAARSPLELPFAITRIQPDSARPGQRQSSLEETLALLPGVIVANRTNPTQDPRISIRGFGARSAFGVRGVRILRDGIPLTLPDGQTPVDYLDLEAVGSVEVIRGSASALYGNAAGGVIDLRSGDAPADPIALQLRGWSGGSGYRRWVAAAGGRSGIARYQGHLAQTRSDGFRQHSRQEITSGSVRLTARVSGTELALNGIGFHMPVAENPGALTAAEFESDYRMADELNVRKGARKKVRQGQLGFSASRGSRQRDMFASVYAGQRTLDNPLTFAIVDIDRATAGATLRGSTAVRVAGISGRLSAGLDVQSQRDDRLNFANCFDNELTVPTAVCPGVGEERGTLRLDQRERISSIGPFARAEAELGRYGVSLGARADNVKFRVEDGLILANNPDDSGERTLRAVSPMAGVVARIGKLHSAYANVSTAFETPTTTELANQADGTAGINADLDPQFATTYELGMKGIARSRIRYELTGYASRVRDELLPFEVPDGAGRRYFRNAGRTRRRGLEAAASTVFRSVELGATYTFSHFQFINFVVDSVRYDGNRLPGIPQQQFQAYATWRGRNAFVSADGTFAGSMFANDANSVRAGGYEILNLRAGGSIAGQAWLSPTIGVQNIFSRRYVPSVNINATADKFYEPAAGRVVYAGLTVGAGR